MMTENVRGKFKFGGNSVAFDGKDNVTLTLVNGGLWKFDPEEADRLRAVVAILVNSDLAEESAHFLRRNRVICYLEMKFGRINLLEGTRTGYFRVDEAPVLLKWLEMGLASRVEDVNCDVTSTEAKGVRLFISHAASDQEFVSGLVDLIRAALGLTADSIRCTSLDGHRLAGGVHIGRQLREDVTNSTAFIGVVSVDSIHSAYVLFELGARWGCKLHLLPVLAPGVSSSVLTGPLVELNALRGDRAAELHQLVGELAHIFKQNVPRPEAYQRQLERLVTRQSSSGATA